jgi:hypothetical protein
LNKRKYNIEDEIENFNISRYRYVIDGSQRLRTLERFYKNEFKVD